MIDLPFLAAVILLTAIFAGFLAAGLLRRGGRIDGGKTKRDHSPCESICRERAAELRRALRRGAIPKSLYEEEMEELELRLLEDAKAAQACRLRLDPAPARKTFLFFLAAVPLFSLLFYFKAGNPSLSGYSAAGAAAVTVTEDDRLEAKGVEKIDENLMRSYLAESPGDLRGWLQYARFLEREERWDDALEAMEKMFAAEPEKAEKSSELRVERAALMVRTGRPELRERAARELELAAQLDPENTTALRMGASLAWTSGDYGRAAAILERLCAFYPQGSVQSLRILDAIAEARNREMMGMPSGGNGFPQN